MSITEGRMPFCGYETYYRIVGERNTRKAPLLLLHGGPGSTHNSFEVLDSLAERDDRQLILYDQIGCGESYVEGRPDLWHMETWINELKALRAFLGLDKIHLLGQSWGGMLLLEYICRYDPAGIKSVILSSTLPSSRLWGEEQARLIRFLPEDAQKAIRESIETNCYETEECKAAEALFMNRHCGSAPTADSPDCLKREKKIGRESYIVGWGPNEFMPLGTLKDYNVIDELPNIREPALIMSGGNDMCTPYIAKVMADGIPNAQWELFRTSRHCLYVEETDRYMNRLIQWLNETD